MEVTTSFEALRWNGSPRVIQRPCGPQREGTAHLPLCPRSGARACVVVHARVLRGMAYAPMARAVAVRRRRPSRRPGRARFGRGPGRGLVVGKGQGPAQTHRGRLASTQLPHPARRPGHHRPQPNRPALAWRPTVRRSHSAHRATARGPPTARRSIGTYPVAEPQLFQFVPKINGVNRLATGSSG